MNDFPTGGGSKFKGIRTIKKGNIVIKPKKKIDKLEIKPFKSPLLGGPKADNKDGSFRMKAFSPNPKRYKSNFAMTKNK